MMDVDGDTIKRMERSWSGDEGTTEGLGGRQDDGGMIRGWRDGWRDGWRREEAAGITTRTRWRAEGWTVQLGG